jgi:hypothetical protein
MIVNSAMFRSDGVLGTHRCHQGTAIPLVRRKHMGVEPISRPTKERDSGFEDRERHRPPSASAPHVIRVSAMSQYKQVRTPLNGEFRKQIWLSDSRAGSAPGTDPSEKMNHERRKAKG